MNDVMEVAEADAVLASRETDFGDLFDEAGNQLTDRFAEMQLIGNLILKPSMFADAAQLVGEADFCDTFHRRVFEALRALTSGDAESIGLPQVIAALGVDPTAAIVGDRTASQYLAGLMAGAEPHDLMDLADGIQQCAERRYTQDADVDPNYGKVISKFGGQRWDEIGVSHHAMTYGWLIENIFPLGEISLIFGDSGTGKSFSCFEMAMCVAMGKKFAGFNVEQGLVVYVAAEAGKGFGKRKIAYSNFHNIQPDAAVPFYLLTKRPDFFSSDDDAIAMIAEIRAIARLYKLPLRAIFLDTLSALAPGMNENASQDVSLVRRRLVMVQEAFNETSVILVHHKPKNGSTPRGHGSLTADFETTIEIEVTDVRNAEGKALHRGTVRKQREGQSGIKWQFTLAKLQVGRNKWGNPETSCVAVTHTAPSTISEGWKLNQAEKMFMESYFAAMNDHSIENRNLPGVPPSVERVVDSMYIREEYKMRSFNPDGDEAKQANRIKSYLSRASRALKDGGVIGNADRYVWYTGKPLKGITYRIDEGTQR